MDEFTKNFNETLARIRAAREYIEAEIAAQPSALALVRELAESDPCAPSEVDGSLSCFFCGGWTPGVDRDKTEHDASCLWLRARKLAGMG